MNERDEQNRKETNSLIDEYKMAYKIKDSEGNVFVWAGVASGGFPLYRVGGELTHRFDLAGMTVIQQYAQAE